MPPALKPLNCLQPFKLCKSFSERPTAQAKATPRPHPSLLLGGPACRSPNITRFKPFQHLHILLACLIPRPTSTPRPHQWRLMRVQACRLPALKPLKPLKTLKTPKRLKTLQTLQKLLRTPNRAGKSYPKASGRSSHSNFAKASRNAQPRMQKLPQGHIHRFFWAVQPAVRLKRFKLLKLYKLAWHAKPRRQNLNLKARSLASSSRPSLPFASLYTLQKVPQGQINGFFAAFKAAVYQPSPSQRRP